MNIIPPLLFLLLSFSTSMFGKEMTANLVSINGDDFFTVSASVGGVEVQLPVSYLFVKVPSTSNGATKGELGRFLKWRKKLFPKGQLVLWTPYDEFTYDSHGRLLAFTFEAINFVGDDSERISLNVLLVSGGYGIPVFTEEQAALLSRFELAHDLKLFRSMAQRDGTGLWEDKSSWIFSSENK